MGEWSEGWLRRGLADAFGPSWRSTVLGLVIILLGAFLVVIGAIVGASELKVLGLGMVPTGILAFLTRDQKASEQAQQAGQAPRDPPPS